MKKRVESPDEAELRRFSQDLQQQILDKIRQTYTATVIDHWMSPRNFKRIENPDGYSKTKGSCGDTVEMFVQIKNGVIGDCAFQTDGCGTTIACGSVVTEIMANRSFTESLALVNTEEILRQLGGLPEKDVHCAQLAAETMRRALADYLAHRKESWKRFYRRD